MTLSLHFLPAAEGDALWITWGEGGRHRMVVDMGRTRSGRAIGKLIEGCDDRRIELLVVTHVDADHIEGALKGLVDARPPPEPDLGDVWFNGRDHLVGKAVPRPEPDDLETYGAVQGDSLSRWLVGRPWNEVSARGPLVRTDPLTTLDLPDGMRVVVLGPTTERLQGLVEDWDVEMAKAEARRRGAAETGPNVEAYGSRRPPTRPPLRTRQDLERLAAGGEPDDTAAANGSSICLVLEWRGRRVLLTGDSWPGELRDGIMAYEELRRDELDRAAPDRPDGVVPFDVIKVPHHGSSGNLTTAWLDVVRCPKWVFSTNGTRFYHPHASAIARLLRHPGQPEPHLVFNVPSEFNRWWSDDATWKATFEYTTETGTDPTDDSIGGIPVPLEPLS